MIDIERCCRMLGGSQYEEIFGEDFHKKFTPQDCDEVESFMRSRDFSPSQLRLYGLSETQLTPNL